MSTEAMAEQIRKIPIESRITGKAEEQTALERALLNNPFIQYMPCTKLVYYIDDVIAGSVHTLPLQVVAHDKIFQVCAGSSLSVDPKFRGRGIAGKLTTERLSLSEDRIAIASGLSSMSFPLFRKLGFVAFEFPRLVLLKRSRPVLEMKLKGGLLSSFSKVADMLLESHAWIQRYFSIWGYRHLEIQEVSEATSEVEEIIATDRHLFRENHTKEWFNWLLKNSFSDDERSKQHLYYIKKDGKTMAFFMTKERFHEQASHRGFKNVILGSVIEWGTKSRAITESQICKAAVLSFGAHVDAVEICSPDRMIIRKLKRCGLLQIGNSNFAIKCTDDSPLKVYKSEFADIENWRIRPAMSDNGLS